MATMLSLIQQATGEMGLGVPTFVAGNTAQDQIQQLALLNAVGNELAREWDWQALTTEYRFNTAAITTTGTLALNSQIITGIPSTAGITTDYMVTGTGVATDVYVQSVDSATQVTISVPASVSGSKTIYFSQTKYSNPADYDRPVNRSQWDKTQHWEMLGPETQQQWQWLKSGFISTGPRTRYTRLGNKFQIWPPLTTSRLLGYVYQSKNWAYNSGGTGKAGFTADTDTCIFPDVLMVDRKSVV